MCGRFVQIDATLIRLQTILAFDPALDTYPPNRKSFESYNVAPQTTVNVIKASSTSCAMDALEIDVMEWGISPKWSKGPSRRIINARSESLHDKATFRSMLKNRIVVPVEGFYEWQSDPNKKSVKTPHYFSPSSEQPLLLAGLHEEGVDVATGEIQRRFIVLTTGANEMMAKYHDRMPVIVAKEDLPIWLSPKISRTDFTRITSPISPKALQVHRVGKSVNASNSEGPHLIAPVSSEFEDPLLSGVDGS